MKFVVLETALKVLSILAGLCLIYIALFLKEDEEGRWQNALETAWIEIDDRARRVGGTFKSFASKVGELYLRFMDRLFGSKDVSIQSVGVTIWLSVASGCLSAGYLISLLFNLTPGKETSLAASVLVSLLAALLPSLNSQKWVSWLVFVTPVLAFGIAIGILWPGHYGTETDKTNVMMLLLMCFAGSVADIVWLWLNRCIARLISRKPTFWWTLAWLAISLASVALMALVSTVESINKDTASFLPFYIKLIGIVVLLTRFFSGFVSLVLLLLLLFLLFHRITWPLLSRFVYPLQRFKIFGYRKFMAGLGICLVLGLPLKDLIFHQFDLKETGGKVER